MNAEAHEARDESREAQDERKRKSPEEIRAARTERQRLKRESKRMLKRVEAPAESGKCSRATTFESGEPAAVPAYEAPDLESDEPLWVVMRRVFRQDERDDKGHSERRLREMLKRDPKAYLQQMIAFEKEDAQQRAADERAKAAVGKREDEPNAERLRQLCRTLIADLTKPKE